MGAPMTIFCESGFLSLPLSLSLFYLVWGWRKGTQLTADLPEYYLPVWFQAIRDVSAITSGVHTLPMMKPVIVASVAAGLLVVRIGYYTLFLILGASLATASTGLLTTLSVTSSTTQWASYQVLYGLGLGFSSQAPNMAAQTVLPRPDVALGASLMFFGQQLLGAIFTSIGQNVLDGHLHSLRSRYG